MRCSTAADSCGGSGDSPTHRWRYDTRPRVGAHLAAAQMATAAATAAQQQLHMLEARLQMEAERREVERAEKAELEAQLAEAPGYPIGQQEKSVELSETERELLETQQELARLQAELHRSRHSSTTASKAASRSASPPPIHQGDARDAPTSDQLQKIAPGQTLIIPSSKLHRMHRR